MGLRRAISDMRDRKAHRVVSEWREQVERYEQDRVDRRWRQARRKRFYLGAGR